VRDIPGKRNEFYRNEKFSFTGDGKKNMRIKHKALASVAVVVALFLLEGSSMNT
jgi:hypothetical protein